MSTAGAVGSIGGSGNADRLREDMDALKRDFATLRDDLKTFASDAGSVARSGAMNAADRLRASGGRMYDAAKEKGMAAKDNVQGQIEDHPFMAVGVAFGVGVLVGAIIARR